MPIKPGRGIIFNHRAQNIFVNPHHWITPFKLVYRTGQHIQSNDTIYKKVKDNYKRKKVVANDKIDYIPAAKLYICHHIS
jgi:hypothetical protein